MSDVITRKVLANEEYLKFGLAPAWQEAKPAAHEACNPVDIYWQVGQ